jgi:predicted methyltransferase
LKRELTFWKIVEKPEEVLPLVREIPKEFKHHESV